MQVTVYNTQKKLIIPPVLVESIVQLTLQDFNTKATEVIIHLVGKKKIISLHKTYFNDPTLTDCISFPIEDSECLGEIFVCPEVAIAYAKKHHINPLQETSLYIVHGLLHLLGYDDISPEDQKTMRRLENRAMKKINKVLD